MMKELFSAAPWTAKGDKRSGIQIISDGQVIARIECDLLGPSDEDPAERMSDEAQANARLLVEAPELFRLCKVANAALGELYAVGRSGMGIGADDVEEAFEEFETLLTRATTRIRGMARGAK